MNKFYPKKTQKFRFQISLFKSKSAATRLPSIGIGSILKNKNDSLELKSSKNTTYKDFIFSLFGCSRFKSWWKWKCFKNLYTRNIKFKSYQEEFDKALDSASIMSQMKEVEELNK